MPDDDLTIPRIRKWMELYHVTPRMLANALGYCPTHVRYILTGKRRLLPENHPKVLSYFQMRKAEYEYAAAVMADLDRCA